MDGGREIGPAWIAVEAKRITPTPAPIGWTHLILGHFSNPNGIVRGSAGFVLESKSTIFRNFRTKNWLQLRCVHSIGVGVGVTWGRRTLPDCAKIAPTPSAHFGRGRGASSSTAYDSDSRFRLDLVSSIFSVQSNG